VHEDLGSALLRLGRSEEARGQIAEALRLDPNSSPGRFDLGCALERHQGLDCKGYSYESALHIAANIVIYSTLP